jgi:hypothetical protein
MKERLQALIEVVSIVSPPLGKFYDALSDEQKARFNDMGAAPAGAKTAPDQQAAGTAGAQPTCGGKAIAWPTDQINRIVRPTEAQRAKLDAVQSAADKAADILKAACPSQTPLTPPSRLGAVGKRLQAMLQAVETVQAPLQALYDSLSDDQKARFNASGRQIFAAGR